MSKRRQGKRERKSSRSFFPWSRRSETDLHRVMDQARRLVDSGQAEEA